MNWEAIGALGEVVGVVAVVLSFLYLGRQIAVSNKQSRASARYAFLDATGTGIASVVASKESASVLRRGLAGELLDDDEFYQFAYLFGVFPNIWTVLIDLYEEGCVLRRNVTARLPLGVFARSNSAQADSSNSRTRQQTALPALRRYSVSAPTDQSTDHTARPQPL